MLWSPEHNAMLDLPIDQRQGNFEDRMARVHPEDHEKVIGELQADMLGRRDAKVEMRSVHRDGSVHWIVSHGRVLYDAADKPIRLIGMVQDITERKAAEAALRQSEERFRSATLHSPMPIMLLADDGRSSGSTRPGPGRQGIPRRKSRPSKPGCSAPIQRRTSGNG